MTRKQRRRFDDREDEEYEDKMDKKGSPYPSFDEYDEIDDYEVTLEQHKRQGQESGCCSVPKLAVFFIFLGLTFGLVFGLVDLDRINSIINDGSTDGTGTNSTTNDPENPIVTDDNTSSGEPYEFMQCPSDGSECCNGLPSNCDLRPNQALWATLHNANHDEKLLSNHEAPLEQALEAGYRGLMLDACLCPNTTTGQLGLTFCHSICGIGHRDANEVFTNINTFLTNNPTEIIFINFEISSGSPTPAIIWEYMKLAGLRQKTYIHGAQNYPIMRNLLLQGKQLILMKHRGMDCTDTSVEGCTPRIAEYFNEVVENNFNFNNVAAIQDTTNFCAPFRGMNGKKRFYSLNNFVTTSIGPNKNDASTISEKSFLENTIQACEDETGYEVNFISVDFWQRGDLLRVAQETNKVREAAKKSFVKRTFDKVSSWFHS